MKPLEPAFIPRPSTSIEARLPNLRSPRMVADQRLTPRTVWVTGVGSLVVVNGIAWRRGTDATLCASTIRPLIAAHRLGPLAFTAGLAGFWHHIVTPIFKEQP